MPVLRVLLSVCPQAYASGIMKPTWNSSTVPYIRIKILAYLGVIFSSPIVFQLLNSKFLHVTELEVHSKVNTNRSKRKGTNDFDFAGSFQGKKMHSVSFKSSIDVRGVIIILGN